VTPVVRMLFGSHLYGTSTQASDHDYKSVFVPGSRDILLQRVMGTLQKTREKARGERNMPSDVDEEAFSLQRYLGLVAAGQTVAMDMLFAPQNMFIGEPQPIWCAITGNRHRLVSRRAGSFVGYCRTQANKYGIKGSRVHAVRNIVEWFDAAISEHGHLAKVGAAADSLPAFITDRGLEHAAIVQIPHPSRHDPIPHLECCNRKAPYFASLKDARAIYARVLGEYGIRALQAERDEGVDWKALSHAVRVGTEAIELLTTGNITFPLPNAAHVLAIKTGRRHYREVSEEIEALLAGVEDAAERSSLPAAPDMAWIEDLIVDAYRGVINGSAA